MKGYGRWIGRLSTGVALVTGLALAVLSTPAHGQERDRAEVTCRCVDREGNEIEDCRCLRGLETRPFVSVWSWPPRSNARLGITVSTAQHARYDRRGVHVSDVLPDGPADRAGLREGDVITHIDGRSVFDRLEDSDDESRLDLDASVPVQRLLARLAEIEPGDEVEVRYLRGDESRTAVVTAEENEEGPFLFRRQGGSGGGVFDLRLGEEGPGELWRRVEPEAFRLREGGEGFFRLDRDSLTVTLGRRDPCFERSGAVAVFGSGCVDGVEMEEMNAALGEYFGTDRGVLVTDVNDGNALGLRAGDVVLAVDGREVDTPDELRRVLRSYELDEDLTLRIVRKGDTMEVRGRRR